MTVHVHVERLVLHGVVTGSADAERIGTVLRDCLAGSRTWRAVAYDGAALDSVAARPIALGDSSPTTIGGRLASSVGAAIATACPTRR